MRVCETRLAPSGRQRSGAASQAGIPVSVLATPHPLPRKSAPGPGPQLPWHRTRPPASAAPAPPAFADPGSSPARRPAACARALSAQVGGPRGEEAAGLTVLRRFQFPSKRDQPKSSPGAPHSSPTAKGFHARGAAARGSDPPGLTCGWARGAARAPVRRRWAPGAAAGGGEAGARRRDREPGSEPRPGEGRAGAGPGAGPRGAGPAAAQDPGPANALEGVGRRVRNSYSGI